MIKIILKTKKGVIHSFELDRGDDFLSTLDIFLKMNKMGVSDFSDISVDCLDQNDSISCRVAKASAEAIILL